nr:modular serine protease-like [Leptinotarsa decemlineata]
MSDICLVKFFLCFFILIILDVIDVPVVSGNYVNSSLVTLDFLRTRRQARNCAGFTCSTTGECIEEEKRCDGTVDCRDGSDEFNDCKDAVQCPGYLFVCDYGACIDEDKKCDGKKDCRDNSDEAHCVAGEVAKEESNCKSDQFQCLSGQCISLDDKCNGQTNCVDKSDETKETCLNMFCPGYLFKCDYGACVDGYAQCNGVRDCVDNSDEEGCPGGEDVKPTTERAPTPTPPIIIGPDGGCKLPNHPENGKWTIQSGTSVPPGQNVGVNTLLLYFCDKGYKLSTEGNLVACLDNGWSGPHPTCLQLCPPLYTTAVTKVRCFGKDKTEIKCDEATDGSSAKFECATYYEPADRQISIRYCWSGSWNLPAPQCIPVCGEKTVSATPLIVNGGTVEKGNYPWVTAIFRHNGEIFLNVCGGSMLTQKVILTAAHCVANEYGHALDPSMIKVGVGKFYNEYKHPNDTEAQYSDIVKVIVHTKYKGDSQRFSSDIAFLITKDVLLLSKVVQPVCFSNLPNIHLTVRSIGVVTGWGYTEAGKGPSPELKEISVPFKDDATCNTELPSDWADKYNGYDKFCAGHYNKSIAVCQGDSGGGLVFQNPRDGRYYVHGIVSVGRKLNNVGCDIQVSSLYTKVAVHYDLLEQVVSQYTRL